MKTNKTILCLDWSNILFRSLFINQLYGTKMTYDNIEDCQSFIFKFATDVCSIINIFKPNNVILLTDSQHAWRKDVLPGEDGYKSNRQKQEGVNWDNIFKCSDDLKQLFKNAGCHVAEYEHSEADDMAALCKEVIFEKYHDYNLIIVSADADLRQLIDFDPLTNQYCAVYNTIVKGKTGKRFLYITQEMQNWLDKEDEVDIFFSNVDESKQYIKDIVSQNVKIGIEVENPNEILLHKIFCGDDGDCVPSFYSWIHNGKSVRITPAKERKIRETLGIKTIADLIQAKDNLKPLIESVAKKDVNDININERLHRQRTLVELNSSLFPKDIQSYKDTVDYMIQSTGESVFANMKAVNILKGSEYENSNKPKALTASVFKDMEKYGLTAIPIF
jgi:hypothetical protein